MYIYICTRVITDKKLKLIIEGIEIIKSDDIIRKKGIK